MAIGKSLSEELTTELRPEQEGIRKIGSGIVLYRGIGNCKSLEVTMNTFIEETERCDRSKMKEGISGTR